VLHGKTGKTFQLIDRALPDGPNVNTKKNKELSKYKEPETDVSGIWKVRSITVPVIIGALETIRKVLGQNPQLLPGEPTMILIIVW
jgi:hypothetical protein